MEIITLIILPAILFILWQYQAFNEGKEEAMYYAGKYTSYNHLLKLLNEHAFWTRQRMVIACGFIGQYASLTVVFRFDWISVVFMNIYLAMSYILVFSFWHNGSLYVTGNKYADPLKAKPYPGGWKANKDGKAIFDFNYKTRKGMLIAGWFVFAVFVFLNLRLCGRI